MRSTAVLALLILAGSALAQLQPIPKDPRLIQRIHAKRVALAGPDGQPGEWIDLPQPGETTIQAPVWANAWDSSDTNPVNVGLGIFEEFYGTTSGLHYFGDTYNAPVSMNDINVVAARRGASAQYFQFTNTWNPSGGSPPSGSARMVVLYSTGPTFEPMSSSYNSLFVDYGVLAGGYYWSTVDLNGQLFGIPLGWGTGYFFMAVGTLSGANFALLPSPGVTSNDFRNMCSPGEPQFPGTNGSSSGAQCWLDTNANLQFDMGELVSLNYTASNLGILQPTTGLYVDTAAKTIRGRVILQDLDPFTLRPVDRIRMKLTNAGSTAAIYDVWVPLGPNGEYEVFAPPSNGLYDLYARSTHWLIRARFNINYAGSSLTGINISLENGDSDMDNEIGIGDFAIISAAFGSSYDSVNGIPFGPWNFMADLDHNDEVDIGDYAIMSANFGDVGD